MAKQLSLFAVPPPKLALAPACSEHGTLAKTIPTRLRIGTMSWSFPGWVGLVYAQGTRETQITQYGLTAYAQHPLLRTVEIDRTYYGPIAAELYKSYAEQVPADFRFTSKAHEDCTTARFPDHARYGLKRGQRNTRLFDVAYATDMVVQPFLEGLGEKAGPLVFQFPPQTVRYPERFAELLHTFLSQLPKGPTYAVEIRNPELLTELYGAALKDSGALHCYNAWAHMPSLRTQVERLPPETRKTLLIRWLLRRDDEYQAAKDRYTPFDKIVEEDADTRREIARIVAEADEAYVSINNKAEGCAPLSAVKLAEAIALLKSND